MKLASFAVQKHDQLQCLSERQKFKFMIMQSHSKIQRMTYKFNHQFNSTKMTSQREVSACNHTDKSYIYACIHTKWMCDAHFKKQYVC